MITPEARPTMLETPHTCLNAQVNAPFWQDMPSLKENFSLNQIYNHDMFGFFPSSHTQLYPGFLFGGKSEEKKTVARVFQIYKNPIKHKKNTFDMIST